MEALVSNNDTRQAAKCRSRLSRVPACIPVTLGKDSRMPYLLNARLSRASGAALPWLVWQAVRKGKYREGFAAKFLGLRAAARSSQRPCVWLHAVSVGEVNLLAPLLRQIARAAARLGVRHLHHHHDRHGPGQEEIRRALTSSIARWISLGPCAAAMRRIRPDVLVLAELELWPNLVRGRPAARRPRGRDQRPAERAQLSRLSPDPAAGGRGCCGRSTWWPRRTQTYAERFRALGARPESVHVTGSMKFDGAETDRAQPGHAAAGRLAGFDDDDVVFLAGSTQEPEEAAGAGRLPAS